MKLKKKAMFFLSLLCITAFIGILIPEIHTEAASQKVKALQAYAAFLETKQTGNDEFAIAYINADAVPELIYNGTFVYTYTNKKVQEVHYTSSNRLGGYYKKKGIITEIIAHPMYSGTYYNKWTNGKFTAKLSVTTGVVGKETTYRNAKGKVVSKAQFQRQLKKLVGTKKVTKFKYYKNTAANRKKYLV